MHATDAPNTGRILDYWLGGGSHLAVDVTAADGFDRLIGARRPEIFEAHRAYLGRAVRFLGASGLDQFVVFGAGVPANGNVHEVVPGAAVLYTDVDSVNVSLGQRLVAGLDRVGYAFCDLADVGTLDHAAVRHLLDVQRPIGLVSIGVNAFVEDEQLAHALSELYDWAPGGSGIALDFDAHGWTAYPAALELLEGAGTPLRMRTSDDIRRLLGRWQLAADGIRPVSSWGTDAADPDDVFMYGCVAEKR